MDGIREVEPDAWNTLTAAGVNTSTLLEFSREDLKDLFCGPENFMLRKKLWKIIEKEKDKRDILLEGREMSTPRQLGSTSHDSSFDQEESTSPISTRISLSSSSPAHSSTSLKDSSLISVVDMAKEEVDEKVFVKSSPLFTIYTDSELFHASKTNSMSSELVNRLVRNTVSNMRTCCHKLDSPREPIDIEFEDMAKALCRKFPCLEMLPSSSGKQYSSVTEEEKQALEQEEKDKLHLYMLKKLKKRQQNIRPTKRPQGKVPSRSRKKAKLELPKEVFVPEIICPEGDEQELENEALDTNKDLTTGHQDAEVCSRYFNSLDKEQKKARPNKAVLNQYLNMEFSSRRATLQNMPKEKRPSYVLDTYPCFKDSTEVIEEVRRTLNIAKGDSHEEYADQAVKNLKSKLDSLIYYGLLKGAIQPPKCPTDDAKIVHIFKGLQAIFRGNSKTKTSKGKVAKDDIFHVIEGDEEPDCWKSKRSAYAPGLTVSDSGGAVLLGKQVLCIFTEKQMVKSVVTLVACFYLLDLDYPLAWLVPLSVLQKIIFGDDQVHPDGQTETAEEIRKFQEYCGQL